MDQKQIQKFLDTFNIQKLAKIFTPELFMQIAFFIVIGIGVIVVYRVIHYTLLSTKQKENRKSSAMLQIIPKTGTGGYDIEGLIKYLHGLILSKDRYLLSFEMVAESGKIKFIVWFPEKYKEPIRNKLSSTFKDARITDCTEDPFDIPKETKSFVASKLTLERYFLYSLNMGSGSITNSIVSNLTNLEPNQKIIVQTLLRPRFEGWKGKGERSFRYCERKNIPLQKITGGDIFFDGLGKVFRSFSNNKDLLIKKSKLENGEQRTALSKLKEPGFDVLIRVVASGQKKDGISRVKGIVSAFTELIDENRFNIQHVWDGKTEFRKASEREMSVYDTDNILTVSELKSFVFRLPTSENEEIENYSVKELPPPADATRSDNLFAKTNYKGKEELIGMNLLDILRHINIDGKTGTGKSEFILGFSRTLMESGYGVCLIDPHQDLYTDLIPRIPEKRRKDVILMDFTDINYPPPLNFLKIDTRDPLMIESITTEILSVFKRLFSDAWGGRTEYYFRMAFKAVLEAEESPTLVHIKKIFTNEEYRKGIIPRLKSSSLKDFWLHEFGKGNGEIDSTTKTALQSPLNKLSVFTDNEHLLYSIAQASCIDFKKILNEKKILLVNVDKGKLGEDTSKLIGSVIISRLKIAAMSRSEIKKSERLKMPFILAVDEFENFVGPEIEVVLDEIRKYGFGLIMLHQRLEQIKTIQSAVFNNVGSLITFRTGIDDARYLSTHFRGVAPEDIANLPNRQAYCKLLVNGSEYPPFLFKTLDRLDLTEDEEERIKNEIYQANIKVRKNREELYREIYGIDDDEDEVQTPGRRKARESQRRTAEEEYDSVDYSEAISLEKKHIGEASENEVYPGELSNEALTTKDIKMSSENGDITLISQELQSEISRNLGNVISLVEAKKDNVNAKVKRTKRRVSE